MMLSRFSHIWHSCVFVLFLHEMASSGRTAAVRMNLVVLILTDNLVIKPFLKRKLNEKIRVIVAAFPFFESNFAAPKLTKLLKDYA